MKHRVLFYSTFLLIIVGWLLVFLFIVNNSVQLNATSRSPLNPFGKELKSFFPEGFSFFTRDPREDVIFIYQVNNGKAYSLNTKNTTLQNGFGLSRQSRAFNYELGTLFNALNNQYWKEVVGWSSDSFTFDSTVTKVEIINNFKNPSLCGEYLLEKKSVIPWAWSEKINKTKLKSSILIIDVKCVR